MFECIPKKIYYPKNKEELQKILIEAKNNKITIHPRGCGTSTAGQSLGHGVLIDTARYMNKILNIGKDYVEVEPGIILEELNKKLKLFGLFMPVDPSSHEVCSVGGMVSNNSSGIHSYLYGDTKDYVIGLEGYFSDTNFFSTISGEGTKKYLDIMSSIKSRALALIDKTAKSSKNSSGYNIKDAFSKDGLTALNSLLVGSEGTLCVMTKIRLKVIPLPQKRITILATFDDLEKTLHAVNTSKKINNISAIELLDKELITTSRKYFTEIRNFFSDDINAGLIFEIDGTEKVVQDSLKELLQVLEPIAKKIETGHNEEQRKKLWWMRKSASSILNRIEGSTRSLRFIEDIAVPTENIIKFYREQKKILDEYGLRTAFFGHIGSGHFHINPRIDTRKADFLDVVDKITKRTQKLVKELNGTMAGEHGDGILRTPYIKLFEPELHELFFKIKEAFDPEWILNPGKIATKDKEHPCMNRYLFKPIYDLDQSILNEIEKCHGCNECLKFCTTFKDLSTNEGLKARGRASILRAIVNGTISSKKEIKEALHYIEKCALCTKCANQCPTGIDITITASLLREHKIIPISLTKKLLMLLMHPVKKLLIKKASYLNKDATLELNKLEVFTIRLGLYYRPYMKEFLNLIHNKNLKISSKNKDIDYCINLK